MFQGSFRNFKENFKGEVLRGRAFHGRFQQVSMVFERSSKEFQVSFKGISRKFRGCPKKVFRMLQGSFKGISRKN